MISKPWIQQVMSDAADAREGAESISEALCGDGGVSGFDMAEMERWAAIRDLSCHERSQLPSEILAEMERWAANAPKTRPLPFLMVGHDLRWFLSSLEAIDKQPR
jgi:hypothetical protein